MPELLRERRPIRVLVSYNRTNFFMKDGVMRGLEVDMMRAYEKHLVETHKDDVIRMVFVPVPFEELVPALLAGHGDIVAAGLTVTAERARQVAFAEPYRTGVRELVVGSVSGRAVNGVADLSGRQVHVMAGSSYAEHLADDNARLVAKGQAPVKVVRADPNLVTEDLLEMTAQGLIEYTVADEQVAAVWKEALPGLRIVSDWDINSGGSMAWAVRPESKALQQSLSRFATSVQQGTLLGNMFYNRYYQNVDHLTYSLESIEVGKLKPMAKLFIKYSEIYGFDWLKIAALAHQESHFDMQRKSSMGAVGVMQIKPSTAAEPAVNIKDVSTLENNIHAGIKYLRYLCDNYFKDVDSDARMDFALAAYNAGPGRIMQVRSRAVSMGLDPNRWFGNTEWAAFDLIGRETTAYVAHIQMYYAAYKASQKVLLQRREAL
ncbi:MULTISPECIES: transporter substrate-binding domain-containing protein [unclassified Pseudodesulfovibrio]|uniref:transglycosylase SLT domain-containing protein n=1 Tax=unclassified Pseudodesulfovibrio TaxID=2661612 RepID=UPI0013E2F48C|nr:MULTISPECIES: transporter substrate-binding domain-containing protein [unclassified Pseudodesulfovibrio]MCJ2165116.1 transporter substrate-binding domain-containing protein [Pseudodesulfovibrio sp. S3-i]